MTEPLPSKGTEERSAELAAARTSSWPVWLYVLVSIGALAALIFGLPIVLIVVVAWSDRVSTHPFDREAWLSPGWEQTGDHTVRQEMVDDLLARTLKPGMPMNEVLWLIGPPKEHNYFQPGEWTYFLGAERGFFQIDSEWLAIDFDELGRIEHVSLRTD